MTVLSILVGLTLVGGAAGLAIRAVALPRLRMAARLDQIAGYGLVHQGEATLDAAEPRAASPHRLATALGRALAGDGRIDLTDVRKQLLAAGIYRAEAETFLGYRVIAGVALSALALAVDWGTTFGILQGVMLIGFGVFGPGVVLKRLATFRSEKIDDALPGLVDLLVVTVEAGLSFGASMQKATERITGPLADELRLTMQEQRMGLPITDALANLLKRVDTPSTRSLVQSVTQSETLGVSIGQTLRSLAVEMRKRRRARAEERAGKAPIKMLFPLVFLIFPSLFVVILAPGMVQLIEALGSL